MSELSNNFSKLTGLRYDIDALIEKATTADEKKKLYDKLAWDIKNGLIRGVDGIKELVEAVLPALATALDQPTEDSTIEVETYTAESATAYNAQLPGAVKAGDVETPAVEAQEAVEAQNAVYSFESFNNEEKEVKYGEGTVEVTELREDGATVKVIENESTDPNAENFVGQEFNIISLDETATLQLYSKSGLAQPIWVTVTKVSDAVEAQEAIAAQDAVLYTEETAAAYNATLEGAVKAGDPIK